MARPSVRVYSGRDSLRALPNKPVLSSVDVGWQGFVLEAHAVPPLEIKEHQIGFHLFSLITASDGACRHWRDGSFDRSIHLRPGITSIFSPCDLYTNRSDQPHELTALAVAPAFLDRVCAELDLRHAELRPQHGVADETVEHVILALQSDLAQGCPAGSLFAESLMHGFAGYVLRRYGISPWPDRVNHGGLTGPRLRRACDYIEDNIDRTLHVSDIAGVAGLSPYHFGKAFKATTGRTVYEYVLDRRISRATRLLRKPELSIADVATLVGLPNQSHFTKLFRSRTSITPRFWRSSDNKPLD